MHRSEKVTVTRRVREWCLADLFSIVANATLKVPKRKKREL
jgi:hypothetical protein